MKRTKTRRHYNPWKSPYNQLYKRAKEYAETKGYAAPERAENPTQEDLDALRRKHEENVKKEREKRQTPLQRNYYAEACNAIIRVVADIRNRANGDWEIAKAQRLEWVASQAMDTYGDDNKWGLFVLKRFKDFKAYAEGFVFKSKQTWDNNNPNEDTSCYEYMLAILYPMIRGNTGEYGLNPAFVDEE